MGSSLRIGVLALIVAFASGAEAAAQQTTAFQLCGTLKSHQPASATAAGSITVGSRTQQIAPGTALVNAGITITVGSNLCIHGSTDVTTGQIVSYTAFGWPANGEICGNTTDLTPGGTRPLLRIRADFGSMPLWLDPSVPPGAIGDRACFRIDVDAQGDAIALQRTAVDHPNERQRISHCGRVNDYSVATASTAGRIKIGSRAYTIAAGTPYTGDPAGDRTDRTAVGLAMCLTGTVGVEGLIDYATRPIHSVVGGTTVEYTPATATEPGLLVIGPTTRFALVIPAGSSFGVDLSRGTHCFAIGLDAAGDAAIERAVACSVGEAAAGPIGGATSSSGATIGSLPATSATDEAPVTNEPALALAAIGGLLVAVGALLLLRPGARRDRDSAGTAAQLPPG